MLQVLRLTDRPETSNSTHRQAWYECLCDCGKTIVKQSEYLRIATTASCGCNRKWVCRERAKTHPRIKVPLTTDKSARRRKIRIFCSARLRAEKAGIPFTLVFDELPDPPAICPVLGIPMAYSDHSNDPSSPSLDRFIPQVGYTPENVRWISRRANVLKRDGTAEEITQLATWMNTSRR